MSKFILLIVCAMALFAPTDGACDLATATTDIAACTLKNLGSTTDACKMFQNSVACYPKDCCADMKAAIDIVIKAAPAGCTAKCGAGAMATPAAALFAVVMSMFYRLM